MVIVAGSLGAESDRVFRDRLKQLTSKVIGVASVYLVRGDALGALNERLGSAHAVTSGRVRTFLPRVDLDDDLDGKRHRVLGPATFARALRRNSVALQLQEAFAVETRAALLERPLAPDIKRSLDILDAEHKKLTHAHRIEERAAQHLTSGRKRSVDEPPASDGPVAEEPGAQEPHTMRDEVSHVTSEPEAARVVEALRILASRWLGSNEPVTAATIDLLEERLAREKASAEEWFATASELDDRLDAARQEVERLREERDDLDLELAGADEDATKLRAKIRQMQEALKRAQLYAEAYSEPETDLGWEAPPNVVELAHILHADSADKHPAFARVEFTGDFSDVEEVQKRDTVNRYAVAFWEFVRTLHDYADCKARGEFSGSVHMYLTSDEGGYKCSPQRHAATESDLVLNNAAWRAERIRRVPETVDPEGWVLMDAHFKPTHADTVAPRIALLRRHRSRRHGEGVHRVHRSSSYEYQDPQFVKQVPVGGRLGTWRRLSAESPARSALRKSQQFAHLAVQSLAHCTQRREPDGASAVVLQNRQVHDADSHPSAQLRQGHPALGEQLVQTAVDAGELVLALGRTHTRPSVSRRRRSPTTKTVPMIARAKAASRNGNGCTEMTAVSKRVSVAWATAAFARMLSKK